jgi:hypothetical protein
MFKFGGQEVWKQHNAISNYLRTALRKLCFNSGAR